MGRLLLTLTGIAGLIAMLSGPPALARTGPSPLDRDPIELLGPHQNYKIEWWYVTGFLTSRSGERLGFQGTFFRFATVFPHPEGLPASPWEPKEIVSFHGAISFLDHKTFISREMTRRQFRSLSGSHKNPFSVNVGENRLKAISGKSMKNPDFRLGETVKGNILALSLHPTTGPLWQDPTGKLTTGKGSVDWAWYYSYPEMTVAGTWTHEDKNGLKTSKAVTGQAWFDHEWTNSALGVDQIGWIWMWGTFKTLQGEKGFMAFQMLKKDGSMDDFRGGTVFGITDHALHTFYVRSKDIRVTSFVTQKSEASCLPNKVEIILKGLGRISGRSVFSEQELKGSTDYWEGAVNLSVVDKSGESSGRGYLEVTGLDKKPGDCLKIKGEDK